MSLSFTLSIQLCLLVCLNNIVLINAVLNNHFRRSCDEVGTFRQLVDLSVSACIDECYRRRRCKLVMVRSKMNYCSLKEDINTGSLSTSGPMCDYYTIEDVSFHHIGPCSERPCEITKRCHSIKNTEIECLKTECLLPATIEHASIMSITQSVGTSNRYRCSKRYKGKGNPEITCLENATWTTSDFICVSSVECPKLKENFFNADRTSVVGDMSPGTTLIYTCREGYRRFSKSVTLTCLESGAWDLQHIGCCHNNSTHYTEQGCIAICDGLIGGWDYVSYSDKSEHCQSIGGELGTPFDSIGGLGGLFSFQLTDSILFKEKKSELEQGWDFEKCLNENGESGYQFQDLRDKIDFARTLDVITDACDFAKGWGLNEPSNGYFENCVVDTVKPQRVLRDYPCQFLPRDVGHVCLFHTTEITP